MTLHRNATTTGRHLLVLCLFVALAILHTWPLATAPGLLSRNDNADVILNEWTLAWVAHQAVADPVHLFDANIFYPDRRTLTYSEHLVPQALMVAPMLWAGVSPVLAHNVALLLGMVLTGWAMCFVVTRWTGSMAAGVVAGALAAFNAHTLTSLAHLQAQHVEFLPLGLLALDQLLARPRLRHGLRAGVWLALQALASGYFLVFSAVAAVVAVAVRPADWIGGNLRRVWPSACVAAATATGVLLPFLVAYWRVRTEAGLVRPLSEVAEFSARWTDYLATGSRVHFSLWSRPFFRQDCLFPGVMTLLLVGIAVARGTAWRDHRARMCLAVAVVAVLLSFGPQFPPYGWIYQTVPLFQGIRAVGRFGHLALVMLAAVAGFGVAEILKGLGTPRQRIGATAVIAVLITAEALMAPIGYVQYRGIPPVYDSLSAVRGAVLVHFPMYSPAFFQDNAPYMLASTRHWHPMLNGYSGFVPPGYRTRQAQLGGFPDDESLSVLRSLGVTHVIVDRSKLAADRVLAASRNAQLGLFATDGTITIYALSR